MCRSGCILNDETGATEGYIQFGYDGEDFMSLDLKNLSWIAATRQAEIIKKKWNKADDDFWKKYLTDECVVWIKKSVMYGNMSLERKGTSHRETQSRTVISRDQFYKSLVCHATGFYPEKVNISWQKDGQDLDEDVDVGETLSNHDRTFQKRAELTVTPDVWKKNQFSCVVEHKSGDPIHMILTEEKIRTNISPGTGVTAIKWKICRRTNNGSVVVVCRVLVA
uniref:Ig-like domain-containing protein n=1 Tax=Denticeps clupeoides TaxID=299321 RepID=A0AAY4CPU5_9TELE